MVGIDDAIGSVSTLLNTAINKIWPDPNDRAKAEALTMTAAADAAIRELQAAQAVMLAEASSTDKWTSRARPSFLYVVYVFLLAALPMGVLYAFNPGVAQSVADGVKAWLEALPEQIVELFQWVMLGYTGARTFEKVKRVSK